MKKPTLFAALLGIGLSAAMLIGQGVNAHQHPLIAPEALWAFNPAPPGTPPSGMLRFGAWMPEGR